MRWTLTVSLTRALEADGKVVWFWHPDAGVKSALTEAQAMVAKKPGAPGRARSSRKTIAQGRPDVSGEPVVTNSYAFLHCMRGCGCIERPVFPAPFHRAGETKRTARAKSMRRDRGSMSSRRSYSSRHCEELLRRSNPPVRLPRDGLLRFARNDGDQAV